MKEPLRFPDKLTVREKYLPATEIQTEAEAAEYLEACIEHSMRCFGTTREQATINEKKNIGYYAGHFDRETAERVWKLFNAQHPMFGNQWPTPEEAFKAGCKFGKRMRKTT